MFGNKKLKKEINDLRAYINDELYILKKKLAIDTEERLVQFHKEISDRYFNSLENIFRFNKEVGLIDKLCGSVKDKDFADLKAQLMQPLLESRWKEKEIVDGQRILNKGQEVIQKKNALHNEIIQLEKQGKDVAALKHKLIAYNEVMGIIE